MNLEWGAIATLAAFLGTVAVTVLTSMLNAARDRGSRDEREKQMQAEIGSIKETSDERYAEVKGRLDSADAGYNALDKALGIIGSQMSDLRSDVSDMKITVGGLAEKLEHTFRNIIAGKYGPARDK